MAKSKILFTGGSGLLGGELKKKFPRHLFPTSRDLDVTNYRQLESFFDKFPIHTVVHAAAFISAPKIDQDPIKALEVNIKGTAHLVKLCHLKNVRLIYISTDYVFDGKKGKYKETDPVWPVNKYAWSKLGGECAVRLLDKHTIIRTSFGPNIFPYEKAFADQWTSRESVRDIAAKLAKIIESDLLGTIHVGGKRRTVWHYAKSLSKNNPTNKKIGKLSLKDVSFIAPRDTSLNTSKFNRLYGKE